MYKKSFIVFLIALLIPLHTAAVNDGETPLVAYAMVASDQDTTGDREANQALIQQMNSNNDILLGTSPMAPTEVIARRTCALIKPDVVARGKMGEILHTIELNGFVIRRMELRKLSPEEAADFYAAHKERGFFASLIEFMTSAPVVALVLEHKDADTDVVQAWRACMGATNPSRAKIGTLRYIYGTSVQQNAVHGSDSKHAAEREIKLIFAE